MNQLIQNDNILKQTDPSNPVVVLPSRAKEPEALISILSQQTLLSPGAPGQHHLEQSGQLDHIDRATKHQHDLVQKITS